MTFCLPLIIVHLFLALFYISSNVNKLAYCRRLKGLVLMVGQWQYFQASGIFQSKCLGRLRKIGWRYRAHLSA